MFRDRGRMVRLGSIRQRASDGSAVRPRQERLGGERRRADHGNCLLDLRSPYTKRSLPNWNWGFQMFIFGGTTEEMETLGYLGVAACQNCGNSTHHVLYQLVKSASVYFVPVAAWGKGNYVICEVCSAGTEVSDDQKDFLVRERRQIPEPERYMDIWDGLVCGWDEAVDRFKALGQENYNFSEAQRTARRNVQGKFPEAEIDFVESWTFVPTQLELAGVLDQVDVKEPTLLMVLS